MSELVSQLLGSDQTVRHEALQAAVNSDDPEVIRALLQLLRSPETGERPRHEIAEVLGRNGHPSALAALQSGLTDSDANFRGLCAIALGQAPCQSTVNSLIQSLADSTNTVRNLAERSLLQMPEAVKEWGFDALLQLLQHPVPLTRSPAARLLGLTEDQRALEPLMALIGREKQWLPRMWAVKGLGDLGLSAAFDTLVSRLTGDEKNRVRAAAAEALGKLNDPRAEAALEAALLDEDGGVRQHVEESLAKLRRARIGHDQVEEHHEPHFEPDE